MSEDIVVKFEIVPGEIPDAANIARAILAYVDMLKVASAALDPQARIEVGLVGVEDGSDVFRLALRKLEDAASTVKEGMDVYPLVSKAVLALAGAVATTLLAVTFTEIVEEDPRIPDDQMAVFREQTRLLRESVELQREQNRFFAILYEEPAVDRFDVLRPDRSIVYSIPKDEFIHRSGLWTGDDADDSIKSQSRPAEATWEVVLIRPVLVSEPRRWWFSRDGLEFSALMDDRRFLEAIAEKSLAVPLAEGIRMRLVVSFREDYDGEKWVAAKGTHKVIQVLDPLPPPPLTPLFPRAGNP